MLRTACVLQPLRDALRGHGETVPRLSGPLPDETTILNPMEEQNELGQGLFSSSGVPGTAASGGNDRGREHHRGAVIDEESCW